MLMIVGSLIVSGWLLRWLGVHVAAFNALMLVGTLLAGWRIAVKAVQALRFRILGIELLITAAVTGAIWIGEYWEAAAVTFLFMLGSYLEGITLEKTLASIRALLDLSPVEATVVRSGIAVQVHAADVQQGEVVIVRPGGRIPVDGSVIDGQASVNQASITGESMPVERSAGDEVSGGTVVESGYLEVHAERVGEDTTFARIVAFVEEAQDAKAETQRFIERFAAYYTPAILVLAVVVYAVTRDVRLALTLLVIACPGALVIAAPVSIVAGIGSAAKRGMLLKGGSVLETARRIDTVVFDKTGTLTEGRPRVMRVFAEQADEGEMLVLSARAEQRSEHPLAGAILREAAKRGIAWGREGAEGFEFLPGHGVSAELDGAAVHVGNRSMIEELGMSMSAAIRLAAAQEERGGRTILFIAREREVLGFLAIADPIRKDALGLIRCLKKAGMKRMILLTGDHEYTAKAVAEQLGLSDYRAGLLPEGKVKAIRLLQESGHKVAMVGDGVNDAPALAAADIGIAVGDTGTDVAIETADLIITSGRMGLIAESLMLSRTVMANLRQNIIFAVAVVILLLAGVLAGTVFMASGMLIHELSVIAVILNAMRILTIGRERGGRDVECRLDGMAGAGAECPRRRVRRRHASMRGTLRLHDKLRSHELLHRPDQRG